jgi:glucose/arabinose dehydrogenase
MSWRGKASLAAAALAGAAVAASALAQDLKHYDSSKKEFWEHPPADWFLGDETQAQKGLNVPAGPATGIPAEEIQATLKQIKLPSGFHISLYAAGVNSARQMAWGDKGTLFVGAFSVGNVYAISGPAGKRQVKTVVKGLKMPTGIAFHNGALYVADINRILKYENAEANIDNLGEGKVVYDDMPAYPAHGWKYLGSTRRAGCTCRSGRRATSACRRRACRRSGASTRRTATRRWWRSAYATASAATSTRAPASTGSPRTRATGSATTRRATS